MRIGYERSTKHLSVVVVFGLFTVFAQPIASAASVSPYCALPQSKQFDFWVGSWDVRNPAGKLEGTDRVTKEYGDCVLQEHFRSSDGSSYGSSFVFFNGLHGNWHYTWVDNIGAFELLEGAKHGANIVLTGWHLRSATARTLDRMTWSPSKNGRIRQLWEVSIDGGRLWRTLSDVYYWPRK